MQQKFWQTVPIKVWDSVIIFHIVLLSRQMNKFFLISSWKLNGTSKNYFINGINKTLCLFTVYNLTKVSLISNFILSTRKC